MYSRRHREFGTLRKTIYASIGAGMLLYEASMDMLEDMIEATKIAQRKHRGHSHHEDYASKEDIRQIKRELEVISQKLSEESAKRHAPEV